MPDGRELVRETWRPHASGDFEAWWRRCAEKGVIAGTSGCSWSTFTRPTCWFGTGGQRSLHFGAAAIRPCGTGATPTTPGCRNARSPSRRRSGAMPSTGARRRPGARLERRRRRAPLHRRKPRSRVRCDLRSGQAENAVAVRLGYGRSRRARSATGSASTCRSRRATPEAWSSRALGKRMRRCTRPSAMPRLKRKIRRSSIRDLRCPTARRAMGRHRSPTTFRPSAAAGNRTTATPGRW